MSRPEFSYEGNVYVGCRRSAFECTPITALNPSRLEKRRRAIKGSPQWREAEKKEKMGVVTSCGPTIG